MASEAQGTKTIRPRSTLRKIAAIAVIVIMVVLALVVYDLVFMGFGSSCSIPAVMVLNESAFENGFKIEFSSPTAVVQWNDVTMQVSDETDTVSWTNISTKALTGSYPPEIWHCGHGKPLGRLCVFLNVTDISANGVMSNGDFVTLTVGGGVFSVDALYSLALIFEPCGGAMVFYHISA